MTNANDIEAAELMVAAAETALRSVDIDSADGWDAWCALEAARANLTTLRQKVNPTDWL